MWLNYLIKYVGNESVYTYTFEHEQRLDCPVCGGESLVAEVKRDWTLQQLIESLSQRQDL